MADQLSYLSNTNPAFVENLYKDFLENPENVSPDWARFFEGFEFAQKSYGETPSGAGSSDSVASKEIHVLNLINAYRTRGHLFTKTNPVRERRTYTPDLSLKQFGLSEADLDTVFQAGEDIGLGAAPLREIIALLRQTYCQSIGAEYMYVSDPEKVKWLQQKMEGR